MNSPILAPAAVLVLWSLVMLGWLAILRLPAMRAAGLDMRTLVGGRGGDLQGVVPDRINWPAHNYNHLMEQPTLFYAICFSLQFLDQANEINIGLAWLYVVLRVVHSLVQATVNIIMIRWLIFMAASVVLGALTLHAAIASGLAWFNWPF